jgi:hypothetical protein
VERQADFVDGAWGLQRIRDVRAAFARRFAPDEIPKPRRGRAASPPGRQYRPHQRDLERVASRPEQGDATARGHWKLLAVFDDWWLQDIRYRNPELPRGVDIGAAQGREGLMMTIRGPAGDARKVPPVSCWRRSNDRAPESEGEGLGSAASV